MKKNVSLLIIFLISLSCIAMEMQQFKFKEITAVKNPRQAFFLTDHQVVVNSENGCSILDVNSNKEVRKISEQTWQNLVMHPNKTKIALHNTDELKIFDTQTGNEEWKTNDFPQIKSAILDHQNAIFLVHEYNHITKIDYQQKKLILALHPYITYKCLYSPKNVYFAATGPLSTSIFVLDNNNFFDCKDFIKIDNAQFFECNPDGSLLAIGNREQLCLLDVNDTYKMCGSVCWDKIGFKAMQFHPNSLYIAILIHNETGIYLVYQDNKAHHVASTLLPIDTEKSPECNSVEKLDSLFNTTCLSFAPNGKNALVTLYNQCLSVPVPFEIIYKDGTQEKSAFIHWFLKNYQMNDNPILPEDLRQFITHILLEICKR